MLQPWRGTWDALPTLPTWLLYFGLAIAALAFPLFWLLPDERIWWMDLLRHAIVLFGWTVAGLVLTAALLRLIVYFRDTYRATNYGVSDLVQIIRWIHRHAETPSKSLRVRAPVSWRQRRLSFPSLGHSMGGFVVTNTIRVLSHVFERKVRGR